LLDLGRLQAIEEENAKQAHLLYQTIDQRGGFYPGYVQPEAQSKMNVTFGLAKPVLAETLANEAQAHGLVG